MRLPWGLEPRHLVAGALGLALFVMPLLILSYDPNSQLERLRAPLCTRGLDVTARNQEGGESLLLPDSGVHVRVTLDGEPAASTVNLFVRPPGEEWRFHWSLDAPQGREIFYLPSVTPGFAAQVRAIDPSGKACPGESPILVAPTA